MLSGRALATRLVDVGDKTRVPFKVRAAEPLLIDVKGADGKDYEVQLVLDISEVQDSGDPADATRFVVVADVAVNAQPKAT